MPLTRLNVGYPWIEYDRIRYIRCAQEVTENRVARISISFNVHWSCDFRICNLCYFIYVAFCDLMAS